MGPFSFPFSLPPFSGRRLSALPCAGAMQDESVLLTGLRGSCSFGAGGALLLLAGKAKAMPSISPVITRREEKGAHSRRVGLSLLAATYTHIVLSLTGNYILVVSKVHSL